MPAVATAIDQVKPEQFRDADNRGPAVYESVGGCPDWVLVAAAACAGWSFAWPTTTQVEFSLLIYPDLINQSRLTNADFFTPYGPGTYWPLSILYEVTGGPSVQARPDAQG